MSRAMALLLAGLLVAGAGCSSDGGAGQLFGDTDEASGDAGGELDTGADDGAGPGGLAEVASRPLPLREGLGTFDNYEWHMEFNTVGPTAEETMSVISDWTFNREPASSISSTRTVQTGPDFDGAEEATTDVLAVEGETCQWDGEAWTYTAATDQQQEVLDVAERLFDFTIVPDSPVEVGKESVAGIAATHFRFSVSGFGQESGALVTANDMDYWVADDTRALLKYEMVVESRSGPSSDPEAEVYRVEAVAELVSANVFVPVTLPADCLAQKEE
jgi:hypothetical protein